VDAVAQRLLSERGPGGRIPHHPYAKWVGAHWVLATLAELGHPKGDRSLFPLREQVLEWILDPARLRPRRAGDHPYLAPILAVRGRVRAHASIEGNAIWSLLSLGLEDERVEALAARLLEWQWPDGGWNCDRAPGASSSSFTETLIPLRALALHAKRTGARRSREAAARAAEVFLSRKLYLSRRTGEPISPRFTLLHFPWYWHYDVLVGLKAMGEAGALSDPRCADALALLRSKRLLGGGFPAEERFWDAGARASSSRRSLVDFGPVSRTRENLFVTAQAEAVLDLAKAAGR